MKIGIISDTHGGLASTVQALNRLKECDHILHCGDVLYHGPRNIFPPDYDPKTLAEYLSKMENLYYVRGNCDSDVDEMVIQKDLHQKSRVLDFGKHKIYAVHGYEETEEERVQKAKELGASIVVSGHTHVKILKKENGILVLNPGSTTLPKDGSKSFAIIEGDVVMLMNLETGEIIEKLKI